MAYTQDNRLISIDTPLGKDVLLLQGFSGHEGISQLFGYSLDLLAETASIPFDQLIGQKVTITVRLGDGGERYINGYVSRFAQTGGDIRFSYYRAEVVPWLWFLTRTADCRIFQNMSVPDIITKVFKDLGFSDFKLMLQGTFEPRDYCVQYRETDFNFISRLMEQYGIFYFFEHADDTHTLVLADSKGAHQPCPEQDWARFDYSAGSWLDEDVITSCQMEQELRPGKYALTDYNFETPSTSLAVNVASTVNVGGNSKFEIYDYPGEYLKKVQGEQLVRLRIEEEEMPHVVISGASTCRAFAAGYRFNLEGHYNQDMDKSYVLTEVHHVASIGDSFVSGAGNGAGERYANHFTCIPFDLPFRPQRVTPKPIVQGPQTAIVVGPAGEEIHTDKYGRVKVQFHWDREGKRDENSSCWMRVSHPWAGKGWGSVSIPRIGQEVIVDFLEGDPDQPIITGRVYNAEQMPPYGLPADGVISGIKSNSTKGGGGYNEMSMNDTKGKEMITIHAQYDMASTIEHDQTNTIHNNRTTNVDVDDTETVGSNQKISVGSMQELSVGANRKIAVAANQTTEIGAMRETTVGASDKLSVGGPQTIEVTGPISITSALKITLSAGGSSIEIGPAGITITTAAQVTVQGSMIKLN